MTKTFTNKLQTFIKWYLRSKKGWNGMTKSFSQLEKPPAHTKMYSVCNSDLHTLGSSMELHSFVHCAETLIVWSLVGDWGTNGDVCVQLKRSITNQIKLHGKTTVLVKLKPIWIEWSTLLENENLLLQTMISAAYVKCGH